MNTNLISKFTKWRVTGAIALVIILSMALSMLPAPAAAQEPPSLDVEVNAWLKNHDPGEIAPLIGCLDEGDQFYINAAVSVEGAICDPVTATIVDIAGLAVLAECEPPMPSQKNLGQIEDCALKDAWWKLYCTGPGPVTITVLAQGNAGDPYGVIDDVDTVNLMQCPVEPCPIVHVDIIEPDSCPHHVNVSQVFGVKAEIEVTDDDCDRDVTGVVAKIIISDPDLAELVPGMPDHWDLGAMNVGDMHEVGWTLHCKGEGDVLVTVDADFDGKADPRESAPDECVIEQDMQACLTIENLSAPDEVCANCTDDSMFTVDADICNYCDHDATGVRATLSVTQGAGLVYFDPLTATIDLDTISAGNCEPVSWDVECLGEGDVTFQIDVTGQDADSGQATSDTKQISVEQVPFLMTLTTDRNTYSVCQGIEVEASMRNCTGMTLNDIEVSITWDPPTGASWVGGNLQSQLVDLCKCCPYEPSWTLHCDEPGPLTINVTAKHPCCEAWTKTVTVEQQAKAHLIFGLDTYYQCEPGLCMEPIAAFDTGQTFHVVAPICNTGEAGATNVEVYLSVLDNGDADIVSANPVTFPYIPGGECVKAFWLLRCDDEGDVILEISDIVADDENTGESIPNESMYPDDGRDNVCEPCEIEVKQIPVDINWLQPYCHEEFAPCEYFTVKAEVYNDDEDDTLRNVTATLIWRDGDNVEFAEGQPPTVPLENLEPGECAEGTWEMHCTDFGEVEFTVLVRVASPGMCMKSEPRIILQDVPDTYLEVEIMSPYCCSCYATSEEFAVTANVVNSGCETAYNAWVALIDTPDDDISVLPPPAANVTLGTMAPGEVRKVTWTVHCDRPSPPPDHDTIIRVETGAHNICCGYPTEDLYDEVTIHQYPAAHLDVNITGVRPSTTINVCENFTIDFEVENTGAADATEVSALLTVIPKGSARPVEGMDSGYTKFIGTIPGHGQPAEKYVGSWELHCKVACESTIIITAVGNDEYGWHQKQTWCQYAVGADLYADDEECWLCEGCPFGWWTLILFPEPGRPIEEAFIEPAQVTVKQLPGHTDLSLIKEADEEDYVIGEVAVFTVNVTNNGPGYASGVIVEDILPAGLNFIGASESQGFYDVTSGKWVVGNLDVGEIATLDITVSLNFAGTICNRATIVASDQHDLDIANDSDEACVDVSRLPITDNVSEWECCLDEGYNLMSLPLIPVSGSENISLVMESCLSHVYRIAYWDAFEPNPLEKWKYWFSWAPVVSDLQHMWDGKGYWVDMRTCPTPTDNCCCEFVGYEIAGPAPDIPPYYELAEGWNLIGFKSVVPKLATDYLKDIAGKYGVIYGYDNGAYFIAGTLGNEYLQPCLGYWIAMYEEGTIFP